MIFSGYLEGLGIYIYLFIYLQGLINNTWRLSQQIGGIEWGYPTVFDSWVCMKMRICPKISMLSRTVMVKQHMEWGTFFSENPIYFY